MNNAAMNLDSDAVTPTLARRLAAGALALALIAPAGGQVAGSSGGTVPTETLSLNFLTPGPTAAESSAAAIAPLDGGLFAVGGAVGAGDDEFAWNAAAWIITAAGPRGGPHLLDDLGFGSRVAKGAASGNGAACAFAGTIYDREFPHPALWLVDAAGNSHSRILPSRFGGEALGVAAGDVNGDGRADIVACGYSYDDAGRRAATLWLTINGLDGNDRIETRLLSNPAGGESTATALAIELENVLISSWFEGPGGGTVAGVYSGSIDDLAFTELQSVPGGVSSRAQDIEVENDETHWVAGTVRPAGGVNRAALFEMDTDGATSARMLPMIDGTSNTQVNGIIAILIGLLVGGETELPGGRSATVWIVSGDQARVVDLNRMTSNRPRGMRLSSVNMLLPYMEQDNLYKGVGDATNAAGQMRGFVATR